jgi:hypothetical protein
LISGELDTAERHNSIKGLFDTNRPRGALWAWTEEQGAAHEHGDEELGLPFLAEAIRLRYPAGQAPTATHGVSLLPVNESDGWLADQSTWKSGLTKTYSYDAYPGNKQAAGWLLNENVAALYRAFSTYSSPVHLSFSLPFDWSYPLWLGLAPSTLELKLDVTGLPDWTKIEVLNYATPLSTVMAGQATGNQVTISVPIARGGVYGFSALVTHADGVTQSTSNLITFTATVPEPDGASAAWVSLFAAIAAPRRLTRVGVRR